MKTTHVATTIIIAGLATLLSGCPPVYYINVRNLGEEPIKIIHEQSHEEMLVNPNETVREKLNVWCLRLREHSEVHEFNFIEYPENLVERDAFSSSITVDYKDGVLFASQEEQPEPTDIEVEQGCR